MAETDLSGVHVWLVLWKAFRAVSAKADSSINSLQLGQSDFRVLEVLLHKGPLPVNTIGPKVELTTGSISAAVDRLLQKGLVSRKESVEDRRARIVALTEKGRRVIERAFEKHREAMEEVADPLSPRERAQLIRLLKKLGRRATADIA